jgi:hypothetical protein
VYIGFRGLGISWYGPLDLREGSVYLGFRGLGASCYYPVAIYNSGVGRRDLGVPIMRGGVFWGGGLSFNALAGI